MFLARSAEKKFHFFAKNNFLKKNRAKNQYFLTPDPGSFLCRGRGCNAGAGAGGVAPVPEPGPRTIPATSLGLGQGRF